MTPSLGTLAALTKDLSSFPALGQWAKSVSDVAQSSPTTVGEDFAFSDTCILIAPVPIPFLIAVAKYLNLSTYKEKKYIYFTVLQAITQTITSNSDSGERNIC